MLRCGRRAGRVNACSLIWSWEKVVGPGARCIDLDIRWPIESLS